MAERRIEAATKLWTEPRPHALAKSPVNKLT
jgi:hypothetical protein